MNIRSDLGWEKYLKPFLYKRLPDGTGWSTVLGTMCALTFMLLVVTGMILAFYYVPSPDKAWDSVQYISNEVPLGNIVRGLHHWPPTLMPTDCSVLCTPTILTSYDNTDHPSARFIDNLFHGILQFALAFFADHGKFGADAVFYQLADGFSENIGLPDALSS